MDARYLKDPSQRCRWKYFDMHPDASRCPNDCYNLWQGFDGEKFAAGLDLEELDADVQNGLDCILGHITKKVRAHSGGKVLRTAQIHSA